MVFFAKERELISSIGRSFDKTGPLCNYNLGGEGNCDPAPEIRESISNSLKDYFSKFGGHLNPETSKKLSLAKIGNKNSKGKFAGEKNYWYGKDTTGHKNQNAKFYYLIFSPTKEVFFIGLGSLNKFSSEIKISESNFRMKSQLFDGKTLNYTKNGWSAIRISKNLEYVTMGNQHPSFIKLISEEGSTAILDRSTLEVLARGSEKHPIYNMGRMVIWSDLT